MSKEKQIEEMAKIFCGMKNGCDGCMWDMVHCNERNYAEEIYNAGYRKQSEPISCGHEKGCEWISVEERLPTQEEYLTHHDDGLDSLKRITIAYMTDTIEYTIGCYDGYKWLNQLGNKRIKDVVAWKPFEKYEPPMMKGGAE